MKNCRVFLITLILVFSGHFSFAAPDALYIMPEGVETRWASPENPSGEKGEAAKSRHGRKGSPNFDLLPKESRVLALVDGNSGTVRRIWLTLKDRSPASLRGLRLDIYWDGAGTPAVSAPLGDFFGVGLGRMSKFDSALFANAEGRGFICFIPMPFKSGMKVVLTNETESKAGSIFYDINYTIGDSHGLDTLYFHAWFNRENPTEYLKDYTILPKVSGRGRFLGVNVGVDMNTDEFFDSWWGEGETKIYLDGDDKWPTLAGTGTEDYVSSAWGLEPFSTLYSGCTWNQDNQYCFYRWHVPDPVYFYQDIRVTLQQIGLWTPGSIQDFAASDGEYFYVSPERVIDFDREDMPPYGLMERRDDVSSCAYFYLDRPENDLPQLMDVDQRSQDLSSEVDRPAEGQPDAG